MKLARNLLILIAGVILTAALALLAAAAVAVWSFSSSLPSVSERLTTVYQVPSPDGARVAYVYRVDGAMAFSSPSGFLTIQTANSPFDPEATSATFSCPEGGPHIVTWTGPTELQALCTRTSGDPPSHYGAVESESVELAGVAVNVQHYRVTAFTMASRRRVDSVAVDRDSLLLFGTKTLGGKTEPFEIKAGLGEVRLASSQDDSTHLHVRTLRRSGRLANGTPWIELEGFAIALRDTTWLNRLRRLPTRRHLDVAQFKNRNNST